MVDPAAVLGELFTLKEVAKKLRVSRWHILNLIYGGRLAFVNVGRSTKHKLYRIRAADLEAFIRDTNQAQAAG